MELHPRKSSRIENLKRRKEEESQYGDKRAFIFEGSDSEEEPVDTNAKKAKRARYVCVVDGEYLYARAKFLTFRSVGFSLGRHERWKNRSSQKEEQFYSDDENSDSESLHESVMSYNTQPIIAGRGRQTNNSLSSATGEIIIHSTEKNRSPEW